MKKNKITKLELELKLLERRNSERPKQMGRPAAPVRFRKRQLSKILEGK
jgi:hypothetical protein